jgi:hypothetical protein
MTDKQMNQSAYVLVFEINVCLISGARIGILGVDCLDSFQYLGRQRHIDTVDIVP